MISENTPRIEMDRLILRQFTKDDAGDFLKLMSDEQVNTYLPCWPLKTLKEAEEYLQKHYLSRYEEPWGYYYSICLKEDNIAIGYVCLGGKDNFELGYALRKEFWNRGIASEAAKAVLDRAKAAGCPFVTATHDEKNPASGGVMKKIGMTYRYSYQEQWQPKDITVTFRMYQINLDGDEERTYRGYWEKYPEHFVEDI